MSVPLTSQKWFKKRTNVQPLHGELSDFPGEDSEYERGGDARRLA